VTSSFALSTPYFKLLPPSVSLLSALVYTSMSVAVKLFIAASKLKQRQENGESIKRFLNI